MRDKFRAALPSIAAMILIFLEVSGLGMTAHADYNVQVSNNGTMVHISGDLLQGLPNSPAINTSSSFAPIPVFKTHLEGDNSSLLLGYLEQALRAKSHDAIPTNVVLDANSSGTSYHYGLNFNVEGATATRGEVQIIDLAWRSFVITDDVRIGNFSINTLVPRYLGDRIHAFAQLEESSPPPLQRVRRWYLDGQLIDRAQVTPLTQSRGLFNFTSLVTPLRQWTMTPDIEGQRFLYRANTAFNLTFHEQFTEAGEVGNLLWNAVCKLKVTVEAPWGSVASDNTLILEARMSWSTWLMIGSIIVTTGLLSGTFLLERKLKEPSSRNKSSRRRA